MKKYLKYTAIPAGALIGYAYYYYVGCASGACPITSNPYVSTIYGALIGAILIINNKKKPATGEVKEK